MKRIKLSIILALLLTLSFSLTAFASGVGSAGEASGVIGGTGIDPRVDARYASFFDFDAEGLYSHGDIVVEYKRKVDDKVYVLRTYERIYTSSERYGLVITSNSNTEYQNDCAYGYIHNGETVRIAAASERINGTFNTSFFDRTYTYLVSFGFFDGYFSSNMLNYYDVEIIECSVPVFSNDDDLKYYLDTGIIRNAIYDSTIHYSGDNLYFKDFRVVPHVSTLFSQYYFDIYYELSDFAKLNIDTLNLRLDNDYRLSIRRVGILDDEVYKNNSSLSIPLKGKENGFKLYLSEIGSIGYVIDYHDFTQDDVLGHPGRSDNANSIDNITYSNLYLRFYLRANIDGKFYQSKRNDFNYDFLNRSYDMDVWIPIEDSSTTGNFDYIKEGVTTTSNEYYYNEVTTNNNGDTVNNYYYYDKNGNKKEITEDVYNNSSANVDIDISVGDGSGEYISISPVDFNQFVKALKDMLDEFDTKGGLFKLLKDTFGFLPDKVNLIWCGSIAGMFIVSVVCILRKR